MIDSGERTAGRAGRAAGDRPTLKTIAYMTGLGITTVSRALKDAPDIGAETKRRVRMIAKQIGYRPNRAGVRLRTGKTNVISLILKTEEEVMGLTTEIICGISEVLAETQYHLIVTPYTRGQDPMEPVRYVLETGSADGIIISRTEPDDARVRYMLDNDFPFATHGRTKIALPHPYHDFDNYAFAAEAVRRLVARGRRRLALIGPPKHLTYYGHMQAGFSDAVAEAGVEEVTLSGITIDNTLAEIKDHVATVMRRPNRPDGFVSGSGSGAIGIVPGIESAGLSLGRDVDLASKQSTEILQWFRPEIIVTFEDFRLAGRELARAVLARIEGRPARELQSICEPARRPPLAGPGER